MTIFSSISVLSKKEIETATDAKIRVTKKLCKHLSDIKAIASGLNAEVKAYEDKIKAMNPAEVGKYAEVVDNPANTFSKDEFIAVYGESEYMRFCHKKSRLSVKYHV